MTSSFHKIINAMRIVSGLVKSYIPWLQSRQNNQCFIPSSGYVWRNSLTFYADGNDHDHDHDKIIIVNTGI